MQFRHNEEKALSILSSIGTELTAPCKRFSLQDVEIHRNVAQQVDSKFVETS